MTVQELIDKLQQVKDKNKEIYVYDQWANDFTTEIDVGDYEKRVVLD